MSKKKRNFRKKKTNTKDLGIKVGDWLKGTEYCTCSSLVLESIFFVSKIETDSIFLENASPRNIRFDQSIESEPWNRENFYREEGKVYFKSEEDLFIEFEKISKEEVLETLRSWSTTIDWTFKRLMSDTNPNKKLMTIENFLERGKDFSGKCIIVKPLTGRIATCIKVDRAKRGDEVYMNVEHSSIVFYPEIAFEIPINSKNSRHCRPEKAFPAGKELLYDTHTLIEVISEEEFMTLRNEVSSQNPSSTQSTNKPKTAKDLGIKVGDWFEMLQVREESNGMERRFFRAETVNPDKIWFKEVNVIKSPEVENPDVDLPLEVDEKPWLIENFHENTDGTFFWETKDSRRWDFERRDIDVVRKEVTCCLNLEIRGVLRDLNLLETPEQENKPETTIDYLKKDGLYNSKGNIAFERLKGKYIKFVENNGSLVEYIHVLDIKESGWNLYDIANDLWFDSRRTIEKTTNIKECKRQKLINAIVISEDEFYKAKEELKKKQSVSNNKPKSVEDCQKQQKGLTLVEQEETGKNSLEKNKQLKYLRYCSDDRKNLYYLRDPEFEYKDIPGLGKKFCVSSCGISIIREQRGQQIHYHHISDRLHLIRLCFDREEEFFNFITPISGDEYFSLWDSLWGPF